MLRRWFFRCYFKFIIWLVPRCPWIWREESSRHYDLADIPEPTDPNLGDLKNSCPHQPCTESVSVIIHGTTIQFANLPICHDCALTYLNDNATTCASCRQPILPGAQVAQAWQGAPFPYTHMRRECLTSGDLFAGVWGNGGLMTLHYLFGEIVPPGTPHIIAFCQRTGLVAHVDFETMQLSVCRPEDVSELLE